jgi:hypothetical protein
MEATTTEEALRAVWRGFSPEARNENELKKLFNSHKAKINETV